MPVGMDGLVRVGMRVYMPGAVVGMRGGGMVVGVWVVLGWVHVDSGSEGLGDQIRGAVSAAIPRDGPELGQGDDRRWGGRPLGYWDCGSGLRPGVEQGGLGLLVAIPERVVGVLSVVLQCRLGEGTGVGLGCGRASSPLVWQRGVLWAFCSTRGVLQRRLCLCRPTLLCHVCRGEVIGIS